MSAQAGMWNFDGRPADKEFLGKFSDAIAQYGPDGENTYFDGPVGMLYRPFHTTLESRLERQPHVSPRGFTITWDGRLDNREDLILQFHSDLLGESTDVAIVMIAYERWGTHCFRKLVGDWAISIWDPAEKALILAKDYAGIRHLYYYLTEKRVVWCTHLAPIVLLSGVSFTLNDEYIAGYMAMFPEAHLTPYREIQAVPPGSFMTIRGGKATVHRYSSFAPQQRIRYKTDAEYEEHFRQVFRQAVRRRLRSDSPILAELSGGLDSSSIVCMADDIIAQVEAELPRLDTISSYDPREPNGDERPYFTKVEEKRGKTGYHIDLGGVRSSISVDFEEFKALPGPLRDAPDSKMDVSVVMRRQGNRVLLSGIGGDELLGGVPDPRPQLADLIVQLRPIKLARQVMAWSLAKKRPWLHVLFQALVLLLPVSLRAHFTKEAKIAPWANGRFARRQRLAIRQLGPRESFGFWLPSRREFAKSFAMLTLQMARRLPVGCQEVRYPYLDQTLIEFLISIPESQLLRPGQRRSLMRRALINILPPEILWRPTKGTAVRSYMVALDMHWAKLEAILNSPFSARLGYIDQRRFQETVHAVKNGDATQFVRLLHGLALELWLRDLIRRGLLSVPKLVHPPADADLVPLRA